MMLSSPEGQINEVKFEKSQSVDHLKKISAIIKLIWELLISNMHYKFGQDT